MSPATRPRRPAIACLRRGSLSTGANWQLILLGLLQNVLFTLLALLSFLPPFLVLGGMAMLQGEWTGTDVEEWVAGLGESLAAAAGPLALAVVASILVGLLAVAVWAWFQGGVLGILVAAERQALSGAEGRPGGWRWFKTFSLRDFSGWGSRYLWRFFWFFHLGLVVGLVLILLFVILAVGVALAHERWGTGAAVGLGCGGTLPFLFALLVFALWYMAAQPAVALDGSGVVRGARLGLQVVGRRFGASLLLGFVLLALSIGVAAAFAIVQVGFDLTLRDHFPVWVVAYGLTSLLQWTVSVALTVFGLATFTSLVVAESGEGPR